MINNLINGNHSYRDGGGLVFLNSTPTLINNTIIANTAPNLGGGVSFASTNGILSNNIIRDNSALAGDEIGAGSGSTLYIDYCNINMAGVEIAPFSYVFWGSGNIDADPLFVDTMLGDYHLTWNSPCKDTGDSTFITEPLDFEGDPRTAYGIVDMGADEFHAHLYHRGDVQPGNTIQVMVIGDPGTTPVTLAQGSGIKDPPQSTQYGDLYLIMPTLWRKNLGTIPSNGILVYNGTVPMGWQLHDQKPLQALVGPQVPGSVLTNLMVLTVK